MQGHVPEERSHNSFRVRFAIGETAGQIEQVPPGLPLVQRAQLGAEQFIQLVAVNLARALKPARQDPRRNLLPPVNREMLPRVRLDLQLEPNRGSPEPTGLPSAIR